MEISRIPKAIVRRLMKLTKFGIVQLDGVADEILAPRFSNLGIALAYHANEPVHRLIWKGVLQRADLMGDQMDSKQAVTLDKLVNQVSKDGMKALEIGSWMGFSTLVLAKTVQKNKGYLYCVDLWGSHLSQLSENSVISQGRLERRAAMFDIFTLFKNRVFSKGYSDTVYPMMMGSDRALDIMADGIFDFIFIDGDHRYSQVKKDIDTALRKVKKGGIICGHDCECRASDLSTDFIEKNCEIDYVHGDIYRGRGVHCGVVKAVSESFQQFDIENDIWFVRK